MKDITVVIPVHIWDEDMEAMLGRALANVSECRSFYDGNILSMVVAPSALEGTGIANVKGDNIEVVFHQGDSDFCSQVNAAATYITTEYFSIMEVDDTYAPKWFRMFNDYLFGNETVGVFLPLVIQKNVGSDEWMYVNEIPLAHSVSNQIGMIDLDLLKDTSVFNITGGIFNTETFRSVGMYKPSIKVSFNYELLMRIANKGIPIKVVPKEGYLHVFGRKDSLFDIYAKTIPEDEVKEWFELAKREYAFDKDRKKRLPKKKSVTLK